MSKILVVDDEFRIREIIKKYANFEGHKVTEAVDGMSAIEICNKETFDIIIMDVMMPELDGFSACKEIRKHCNTPIIMLSARGEEYDKIHGFELGIDDYVVKPFSPKELMMRVNAVLREVTVLTHLVRMCLSMRTLLLTLLQELLLLTVKELIWHLRNTSYSSIWLKTRVLP